MNVIIFIYHTGNISGANGRRYSFPVKLLISSKVPGIDAFMAEALTFEEEKIII